MFRTLRNANTKRIWCLVGRGGNLRCEYENAVELSIELKQMNAPLMKCASQSLTNGKK